MLRINFMAAGSATILIYLKPIKNDLAYDSRLNKKTICMR